MRSRRLAIGLSLLVLVVALTAYTQMASAPARPFRNGSVWQITFVHVHAGMDNAYRSYLTTDWKREQEALKQQGITLSYKVIGSEAHGTNDWDLMLMTEYKDLATMEANESKVDAIGSQLVGGDQKSEEGYRNRSAIRDIVGTRLAREVILEPRK